MFSWKPSVGVQTAHKFLPISTSPVSVYRTIRLLFGRPHIGFFIWIQVRSQFDEIKRENALTSSRGRRGKALRNVFINRIADNFYTGKRAVCDWKYCTVIDVFLNKKLIYGFSWKYRSIQFAFKLKISICNSKKSYSGSTEWFLLLNNFGYFHWQHFHWF